MRRKMENEYRFILEILTTDRNLWLEMVVVSTDDYDVYSLP